MIEMRLMGTSWRLEQSVVDEMMAFALRGNDRDVRYSMDDFLRSLLLRGDQRILMLPVDGTLN